MQPMELKTWVEAERGRALTLSKDIDVPPSFVSKMVAGSKAVPVERCVPIERATGGAVTRQDLRPDDWQDIWPELAAPENIQQIQAPAFTPPAQSAIATIAKPGPTEPPATTQHPPRQAPPGAAAGGDTGAAWDGLDRRDPDAGPMAFPDLERRAEVL